MEMLSEGPELHKEIPEAFAEAASKDRLGMLRGTVAAGHFCKDVANAPIAAGCTWHAICLDHPNDFVGEEG
jgi:hypothetical protein